MLTPAERSGMTGPVSPSSRLVEVDIVRGFALFGVLLVNMYNFGADSIAWTSLPDQVAFAVKRIFFEAKSWALFSMLFGFGFALQMQRAGAWGRGFLAAYLRRLGLLFAFGAAHALLFDGDILMLYAELGLALLMVQWLPAWILLLLAFGLLLVFPLVRFSRAGDQNGWVEAPESVAQARAWMEEDRLTHVYATGSLAEVAADNADAIPALPLEDVASPESGLAVFAMFLVGFCLGRSGVLGDIAGHAAAIARVRAWGLVLGLAAMVAERILAATTGYALFEPSRASPAIQLAGDLLFALGAPTLALGYAATLALAAQSPHVRAFLAPLAAVGRLALTVYLTQTLLFTTLFYGYGFGQAFQLGPAAVTAWATAIFGLQLVACHWWSKRFRFGPVEWLWRSLTYLRWQPFRLPSDDRGLR